MYFNGNKTYVTYVLLIILYSLIFFQEKNTKTKDDIYNHLHETRVNSDLIDSPYDHAQCLTEIQSTRGKVLEDNYIHISTLF